MVVRWCIFAPKAIKCLQTIQDFYLILDYNIWCRCGKPKKTTKTKILQKQKRNSPSWQKQLWPGARSAQTEQERWRRTSIRNCSKHQINSKSSNTNNRPMGAPARQGWIVRLFTLTLVLAERGGSMENCLLYNRIRISINIMQTTSGREGRQN